MADVARPAYGIRMDGVVFFDFQAWPCIVRRRRTYKRQ